MSSNSLPHLPPRSLDSHKGVFGHTLLIGGSRGMAGAISLSGMAALRSGAGLVTVATAEPCLDVVSGFEPSYMTVPLAVDAEGRIAGAAVDRIVELSTRCTSVGCGPGLQQSDGLTKLVGRMYADLALPMVVDADALNALAKLRDQLSHHAGPRILTPHPGEFARLAGIDKLPSCDRIDSARQLAHDNGCIVVLKGHQTVITDGATTYLNQTGNPGMATGGCGDVLTGIITALVGQGLSPLEAAQLGAHLHGRAGDLAAAVLGEVSLIASDLIRYLPDAFRLHARDSNAK